MWISKKEYNRLVDIDRHYEEHVSRRSILFIESIDRIKILSEELTWCKSELEKYKQKYADEVNKRLELIALYEGNNCDSETD